MSDNSGQDGGGQGRPNQGRGGRGRGNRGYAPGIQKSQGASQKGAIEGLKDNIYIVNDTRQADKCNKSVTFILQR